MLTQEQVKNLFDYVPETGDLVRRINTGNQTKSGDRAGSMDSKGYLATSINNRKYRNHQIVFLYHHGHLPKLIDHINQNKTDNRIENLREATYSQNHGNKTKRNNNTSGWKGVFLFKKNGKWCTHIRFKSKGYNLGYFSDLIDAAQAYNLAAEQHFGEFAYFNGLPDDQAWGVF